MDRQRFYFLYVNINSMAELALKQGLARVLADLGADDSPAPQMTQEEIDAHLAKSFENIDLSALDGLGKSSGADVIPAALMDESPLDIEAMEAALANSENGSDLDDEIDIEGYMERAYSFEERLRTRIDHHYQRADVPAIDAALAQLPGDLPSLTRRLTAEEMGKWLTLYEEGNDVLNELTVRVRQLDMSTGAATL